MEIKSKNFKTFKASETSVCISNGFDHVCRFLHCVPKTLYTKLMVITLSILNGFSKFFQLLERELNYQPNSR